MILAIDTSTQWMGIAIFRDEQILYEKIWRTNRRHTVELAPAIQCAFEECGESLANLKAVTVALGPGSFTSLRIGLAVAKGLALSLHVPVIGVPSLDVMAACQPVQELPLVCVLKVGRDRLAACRYKNVSQAWMSDGEIFTASVLELENRIQSPTLICGELDAEDRRILERKWRNAIIARPAGNTRRPGVLAQLAAEKLLASQVDDVVALAPIYVHTINSPSVP
jgi:tRNA threonylcarbamoyladenosine biosynthesis protein TsaB